MNRFCMLSFFCMLCALSSFAEPVSATGKVVRLEVWDSGNVAFFVEPPLTSCNKQVILNKTSAGAKNLLATVLTAKAMDLPIRIYSLGCVPADGYGGSYNSPSYIYLD